MKLFLKNIGKIDEVSVEIDGITIIAGENNTGKSTVGRTLFSVFNSFYNIDEQIRVERIKSVEKLIDLIYRNATNRLTRTFDMEEIAQSIVEQIDLFRDDTKLIREEIIKSIMQYDEYFEKHLNNSDIDGIVLRIKELLNVSDVDIFKTVLEKKLDAEFNAQISNIYAESVGAIQLQIKDENIDISIEKNNVVDVKKSISLNTEALYLDDPFVLDEPRYFVVRDNLNYEDHRTHLRKRLLYSKKEMNAVEEIVVNNKFENIYNKIAMVCSGDIIRNKRARFEYRRKNSDKILDIRNLSTGMKTFAILKILLQNGIIEYNGTIILDEPEIHLHPEWQLLFAELIVLINKEFSMHILLNTHSPYFLRAIQVYSAKYEVADKCRYYLSETIDDYAHISDVTDDVEKIYFKLSRPLQQLEDVRWQDD